MKKIESNKNETKIEEITFSITSNPWINNGLARLAVELEREYPNEKVVQLLENNIHVDNKKLKRGNNEDWLNVFSKIIHDLAAGTYNFNSNLKRLNRYANGDYTSKKKYPQTKKDMKNEIKDIPLEQRKLVKRETKSEVQKNESIWKQRTSYMGSRGNYYLSKGLNFEEEKLADDLKENINNNPNKDSCPICGSKSIKLLRRFEVKQSFNPLAGEHHNNILDGFSHGKNNFTETHSRRKNLGCPKCLFLSYVSLFDYYIPFFTLESETHLALPKTQNLETLKKIVNNLSIDGQYIDFDKQSTIGYGKNIKSLPHKSKSASILALLHNIKNKYRKTESDIEELLDFQKIEKDEFTELTDWILFTKSYNFETISSSEDIYTLFEEEQLENGEKVYLVPDLLRNFNIRNVDKNMVEKFYRSILKLDIRSFSECLFYLAKKHLSDKSTLYGRIGFALKLWKNIFLDKMMEVPMDMNERNKKACRKIARTIGENFKEDVGVLTKFAYSSEPKEFKEALEDSSFRLAKMSSDSDNSKVFVDDDSLQRVYEILEEEEKFDDFKNYFVSFMSIYVISANYTPKEKGDKNE